MTEKVNSLLKQTEKIIEKYDAIDKATGGKFNIFTILERDRSETRHSRFLAELLNPKGSHGQGGLYLGLFYKMFEDEFNGRWINENTSFDIEEFSKKAWAHTEQSHSVENKQGYIDIVIETDQYAIVIENKIDAGDQNEQLQRYVQSKKTKSVLIIYLSPDLREPSNNSKGILEAENIVLLSYATHIIEWLTSCISESATLPSVRETLVQYEKLLRKITNQNGVDVEKEMIELLFKDGNIKVAQDIYNALPKARAILELKFWKKVSELLIPRLEKYGLEIWDKPDKDVMYKIIKRAQRGTEPVSFFYKQEYEKGKYFNFGIGCDNYKNEFYIGCYPCDEDGNYIKKDSSQKCFGDLKNPFETNEHYIYFGAERDFYGDGLFELLDQAKCEKLAQDTVKDIEPILAKLQNSIKNYFVSSNKVLA